MVVFSSQFTPPSAPIYTPGTGVCAWATTGSATSAAAATKAFFMSFPSFTNLTCVGGFAKSPTPRGLYTPQLVRRKERGQYRATPRQPVTWQQQLNLSELAVSIEIHLSHYQILCWCWAYFVRSEEAR